MSGASPNLEGVINSQPLYERMISAVAPGYGLRRLQSRVQRHLFAYEAARADRIFAPKRSGQPAESMQTQSDRITMMWEALDLVENFPRAKGAINRYGTFLTPTEYAPATGDRDYDTAVSNFFHGWCKRADVTGRHSFRKLMQLAAEMRPSYGDCGVALRRDSDQTLKIQLIPGDRIGNPYQQVPSDMGPDRRDYSGVITDRFGRPLFYRVYTVTETGQYTDPEDIPASSFFHYFDPFRVDQYRGVTDFHSVVRTARMTKDIMDAEKVGVLFASQQAALIFNERGQAPSRNMFTPQNAAPLANGELPKEEQSKVGMLKYLERGDRVEVMKSRPGTAFEGFLDMLHEDTAIGLGSYPPGVLWGTQNLKGPSVRAEFAQADRANTRNQGILDDKLLTPIKDAILLDAIARKEIPPPPRASGETFAQSIVRATAGTFRFPPRLTIDVGRESVARISELNNGAGSLQEIAAEDGKDAYTRIEEKAQAAKWIKDMAAKYDVPETAIILPGGQLPNTPAAAAAVGEKAGEDAAEAQADSSPQASTTTDASRSFHTLLAGPSAARKARAEHVAIRQARLATLRQKTGEQCADAETVSAKFRQLAP